MDTTYNLPAEKLPFKKKNDKWRKKHLDWAVNRSFFNDALVRKSAINKKINYDLLNGIVHISDMEMILNPEKISAKYIPDNIQHYPIMNSKLNVLRGEELNRIFDYKVVVSNPNAITEMENQKREAVLQMLQQEVQSVSKDDNDFQQRLQKVSDFFTLEYQDMRELRANLLLNHYTKELGLNHIFNDGFTDVLTNAEEIYQVELVSGEPVVRKINPIKAHIFRSGYSNKVEDADIIVLEDYWSPGQIIDTFYDKLTEEEIKKIDRINNGEDNETYIDENDNGHYSMFGGRAMITEIFEENAIDVKNLFNNPNNSNLLPYDTNGNIRVIRMYWKSKKKIKRIKRYNKQTGDKEYYIRSEFYKVNEILGEEEEIFWINEAWQGTLIGKDIYVDIRPCPIQFNRMSNPSRCHFGIVGTIYNLNDDKPFSLVDMMKPYSYLYDAVHDRLNKALAHEWGALLKVDFAKIPKGWDLDKWLYFAKTNNIAVIDSFKEGNYGAATGKLAGGLNNNSSGVIDASVNQLVNNDIQLLTYIKNEMSEIVGITPQREGQVSYRETVGGIEHATQQSSHITEWLFNTHDDTKKRVLETLLEVAKYALKGKTKKFQYILSDGTQKIIDVDGDEFAECDYGLIVDNSNSTQTLNQQLDTLAQAALQTQTLNFSTIMKLYSSSSVAEKQRFIEKNEADIQEQKQQEMQQQQQMQEQQQQMQMQLAQQQQQFELQLAKMKLDAQIQIAQIQADASIRNTNTKVEAGKEISETDRMKLDEQAREFNIKTTNDINKTMIRANAKITNNLNKSK